MALALKMSFCLKNAGFVNILFRRRKHFDPLMLPGLATLVILEGKENGGQQASEKILQPQVPAPAAGPPLRLTGQGSVILEKYLL